MNKEYEFYCKICGIIYSNQNDVDLCCIDWKIERYGKTYYRKQKVNKILNNI